MNTRLQALSKKVDALGFTLTMAKDPEDNSTIAVLGWESLEKLLDKLEARPVLKLVQVAPLGMDLDRDGVREVWDTFVKPDQDAGNLQSIEMRLLMTCLRSLYISLPATEKEPDVE